MTQTSAPSGSNPFQLVLRRALVPTIAAGVLAALVLGLVNGLSAGLSGLVGVLIATAFFGSGMFVVSKIVRDTTNPVQFMAVGMAVYFAQVIVLLFVLIAARQNDVLDTRSAGIAMLVAVLVWQVAQMITWCRAQMPIYDETADPAASPSEPAR